MMAGAAATSLGVAAALVNLMRGPSLCMGFTCQTFRDGAMGILGDYRFTLGQTAVIVLGTFAFGVLAWLAISPRDAPCRLRSACYRSPSQSRSHLPRARHRPSPPTARSCQAHHPPRTDASLGQLRWAIASRLGNLSSWPESLRWRSPPCTIGVGPLRCRNRRSSLRAFNQAAPNPPGTVLAP
jgi:hypothetical protein